MPIISTTKFKKGFIEEIEIVNRKITSRSGVNERYEIYIIPAIDFKIFDINIEPKCGTNGYVHDTFVEVDSLMVDNIDKLQLNLTTLTEDSKRYIHEMKNIKIREEYISKIRIAMINCMI